MSKPEDIPQDVWDKAMSFLEASPMVSIPCTSDDRCHLINDPQTAIARAIMDATAEEREACAKIADVFELERPGDQLEFIDKHSGYNWDAGFDAGCTLTARAIRKRGEG